MPMVSSKNSKFWDFSGLVSLGMWSIIMCIKCIYMCNCIYMEVSTCPVRQKTETEIHSWPLPSYFTGFMWRITFISYCLPIHHLIDAFCELSAHLLWEDSICSNQSTTTCVWWFRAFILYLYLREGEHKVSKYQLVSVLESRMFHQYLVWDWWIVGISTVTADQQIHFESLSEIKSSWGQ